MKSFVLSVFAWSALVVFASPLGAGAQTRDAEAAEILATSRQPEPNPELELRFRELDEANERIRRTRIALLSTTGAFGLGAALSIAGASQCSDDAFDGDLSCSAAGKALWGLGGPLMIGGALGMLSSGILLGVRQRKRRSREYEIRRYSRRRLQWDLESARLVF